MFLNTGLARTHIHRHGHGGATAAIGGQSSCSSPPTGCTPSASMAALEVLPHGLGVQCTPESQGTHSHLRSMRSPSSQSPVAAVSRLAPFAAGTASDSGATPSSAAIATPPAAPSACGCRHGRSGVVGRQQCAAVANCVLANLFCYYDHASGHDASACREHIVLLPDVPVAESTAVCAERH